MMTALSQAEEADNVGTEFHHLVSELRRVPSQEEYIAQSEYGVDRLLEVVAADVGSYEAATEALGYIPSQTKSGVPPEDIDREWLEADFERVVDELGRVPSREEYDEHGCYEMSVLLGLLSETFLYADVVKALDYSLSSEVHCSSPGRRIPPDAVRDDFERVVDELGRVPSREEYDELGEYSSGTVANKFATDRTNSFTAAVTELGYEPVNHGDIPTDALRADFEHVVDTLGKVPSWSQYLEYGKYSISAIADRFGDGSYPDAVEVLGYDAPGHRDSGAKAIPKEDLREDVERVIGDLGRVPSYDEYDEHGRYSSTTVGRKFAPGASSSFHDAIEGLGYEVPEEVRGEFPYRGDEK